ncbi:PAS domain-containing sensor histidine kinase [Coraliomargarita algicola]|uniref:histidine kinase n=1 Tax=Coraliomargarita algicola TaxID=3092156 RepID=A0ABZ0RNX4_9BACT|nr:PAS domain-containing sensor histidine kinase [Coraliomargarita sp. J2-16]WPJ97817.1 PAS domain-containing sensor histidine kinase [Coraliomargarita sp. J2-16]
MSVTSKPPFINLAEDVAIQGYNESHEVVYWNRASERLYGYSRKEALGQTLENLIIPESMQDQVRNEINAWLATGVPPLGGFLKLQHKDGSLVEVHSSHIFTRNGDESVTMYCIDLDAEQAVGLPSAFSDRIDPRENPRSQIYSCLSHEFRTPLNAITGYSDLLRMSEGAEDKKELLEQMNRSAYRLLSTFQHMMFLLAWSRGDLSPQKAPVRIFEVVIDSIRSISEAAAIEEVQIELKENDNYNAHVLSDSDFLTQTIYAILMAALSTSSRKQSISVEISDHADGSHILLDIRDKGQQLDAEALLSLLSGQAPLVNPLRQESHGQVLFLPVARDLAVKLGAMFTMEQIKEGGNRYLLSLPRATPALLD